MVQNETISSRTTPLLLTLTTVALLASGFVARDYEKAHPLKARDLVEWKTPSEAVNLSKTTKKPILYDFTASWCGPCKNMALELFTDPTAADFMNTNFVCAKVPLEADQGFEESTNLARVFQVSGIPTLVASTPDSSFFRSESGYQGARHALDFLRRASAELSAIDMSTLPAKVNWCSEKSAVAQARNEHKPLLLLFCSDYIPSYLYDKRVVACINQHYIPVSLAKLDESTSTTLERNSLMLRMKRDLMVSKLPTLVLMPENGKNPTFLPGSVESTELLDMLRRNAKQYNLDGE